MYKKHYILHTLYGFFYIQTIMRKLKAIRKHKSIQVFNQKSPPITLESVCLITLKAIENYEFL